MHKRQYHLSLMGTHLMWIERYLRFYPGRDERELGLDEVVTFLTYLSVEQGVFASAHDRARAALLFLYRDVLQIELGPLPAVPQARRVRRIPSALTAAEVEAVLKRLPGAYKLVSQLIYGSGLRVLEAVALRVRDLDLDGGRVLIHDDAGQLLRVTILPRCLIETLRTHLDAVHQRYLADLAEGLGTAPVPVKVRRANLGAGSEWQWQFAFPVLVVGRQPRSMLDARFHLRAPDLEQVICKAVRVSRVRRTVSCYSLRQTFAAHLREAGYEERLIQALLGQQGVVACIAEAEILSVRSPLDVVAVGPG